MGLTGPGNAALKDLRGQLEQIANGNVRRQVVAAMARQVRTLVDNGFRKGVSPYGETWKPVLRGGKPLLDFGRLSASFRYDATGETLAASTNVRYAGVHQDGALIRAVNGKYLRFKVGNRWARKAAVAIPRRQMLPDEGDLPAAWAASLTRVADEVVERYVLAGKGWVA